MPTLKQKRLAKAIPNSDTIWEASQKAGYSKNSRKMYSKGTKRYIAELMREGEVTKEWGERMAKAIMQLGLNKGDLSNANRSLDLILTVAGVKIEKREQTNITKDELWEDFKQARGNRIYDKELIPDE